jgi:hypothetical protein
MNETELENELRALRPASPSRGMEQGIMAQLEAPQPMAKRAGVITWWMERLLWCGGGALAAWIFGISARVPSAAPNENNKAPQALQSLGMTEEQIALTDEGVSMRSGEPPTRVLHRTAMERHTWADAGRRGVLEVQVPREDVIFLPVKMQ